MLAAEARQAAQRRSIRLAITISLLVHAAALFYYLLFPELRPGVGSGTPVIVNAPLRATLPKRARNPEPSTAIASTPSQAVKPDRKRSRTQSQIVRSGPGKAQNTQPTPAPVTGSELAARALAQARSGGLSSEADGGTDSHSTRQDGKGTQIEPFSLQMYFDSFIKKLNRSSAFVKRDPRTAGRQKALVEIIINQDGSLREYRILRAADQQVEIDFIKRVVDLAVPFAAFPPDIRRGTDTLSLKICIQPPDADGGGFGFSRTSGGNC